MEFEHLFSILSVFAAGLFFAAGFSAGWLKRAQIPYDEPVAALPGDWGMREAVARETAVRETAAEEIAASAANARDSAAKQATADAESARLRTEARAATAEIARLKAKVASLERRDDAGSLQPMAIESISGPTSFQGILGRLSKTQGIRAAVLGDALGLPVASFGEQSESLAGCCGFITQAASKARDFLHLGGIRRIVIEDERLATLTACSIAGTDLFLATLTSGPGPELSRMIQVLTDVKSFMSQRSQTS
jgi:predicted regulator of Ras-like GTPase activity (Roadblock/LC7/MglB family)